MNYDVSFIEKKWLTYLIQHPFKTKSAGNGKKFYCLDMFPYPSGSGLHVGHWRGYVLSDVYARIKLLQGYNVLHPMGWDAFGLPAENDAIKKGIQPQLGTAKNIAKFKEQLYQIGAIYDWDKELNTTDPYFYKWTQWIFIQMFQAGLAYEAQVPINWCPVDKTGLANEEVINGTCERCGAQVEQKRIRQWMLKITEYAEKLLEGLNRVEWPEKVKSMQRNWIGKSDGLEIYFAAQDFAGKQIELPVYTTRPDTIFGVPFLVMAPNHELVSMIVSPTAHSIHEYCRKFESLTAQQKIEKEKTGIFSGVYATNPATKEQIPVYIANYVLAEYGTGIVMGVPAHDQRDFEFAQQFDLPRPQVIAAMGIKDDEQFDVNKAYDGDGILINSGPFNGLDALKEGKEKISDYLVEQKAAVRIVHYKLRDWVFSRQRYWGEPIPIIHCASCGLVPVPEDQLPVKLPPVEKYQPTGTGESPLAAISEWVNTQCPQCNKPAKRETNTMPQWAGSSWYFLRYPNPHMSEQAFDQKDLHYWFPVDLYVGGIEHAILHLLYARFYTKVLFDLGRIPFDEPFKELFNQGMVLKYSDVTGQLEKMSKSKGNVVNPDEIVEKYGSDALRMYILFMGPPELDCEWQDNGIDGIKRFLYRFWDFMTSADVRLDDQPEEPEVTKRLNQFMRDFQERIDRYKPNTAVASFMEFLNDAVAQKMQFSTNSLEKILIYLSVMAPCIAQELLETLLHKKLIDCEWYTFDPVVLVEKTSSIIVQVNGKLRANLEIKIDALQEEVEDQAEHLILKWLEDKEIIKVVYLKNRLINFVVRE